MLLATTVTDVLLAANALTLAAILVVGFSLFAYIALHNWRNAVGQSFALLLASLLIVLGGAVLINQAQTTATKQVLWRIQWLGIALAPATYYHFAEALLRSTSDQRHWTRVLTPLFYSVSIGFWFLAVMTNELVRDARQLDAGIQGTPPFVAFTTGPLFWLFVSYFLAVSFVGVWCIRRARQLAVTPTNRRRLWYLSTSFMAPLLGVLPYLLFAALVDTLPLWVLLMLLGASTTGVGVMMTLTTYSVAFHGMIVPDRVVKYNFLRYILYGPLIGVVLIICLQLVDPISKVTGLPRDTISVFGVLIMTVLMPIFVGRIKPAVDMIIYRQDSDEMRWIRDLDQRTFTRSDLRQLLENTLVAICGTLRIESGFVATGGEDHFLVQVSCGPRRVIKQFLAEHPLNEQVLLFETPASGVNHTLTDVALVRSGFCLLPLYDSQHSLIGIIGMRCTPEQLSQPVRYMITSMAHQMELALTHMQLQENAFNSLRGLAPQSESLHLLTNELETSTQLTEGIASDIALHPEFGQQVKDALSHYWGGPKLSASPLLNLQIVRAWLDAQGGSPTRALQHVLRQAIDNIRPADQLDPTAPEWMLYNILELRFLKGLRIREIIDKLAMSESDFYRKQKVAVEEVARQLVLMEDQKERTPSSR